MDSIEYLLGMLSIGVLTKWPHPWFSKLGWSDGVWFQPSLLFCNWISCIFRWGHKGDSCGAWEIEGWHETLGDPRNKSPVVDNWLNSYKTHLSQNENA